MARRRSPKHPDVFLSHSHADIGFVTTIAEILEDKCQIKVWLDQWKLIPGEGWQRALAHALDTVPTCAVFLSNKTPNGWFHQEIQKALNRQASESSFRVIPVLLPGSDESIVGDFLDLRTWVRFQGDVYDPHGLHRLVSGIRGVEPGRPPVDRDNNFSASVVAAKEQLKTLRSLHDDQLVDDEIAREFQRKILEHMMKLSG
jgi:TIR domain